MIAFTLRNYDNIAFSVVPDVNPIFATLTLCPDSQFSVPFIFNDGSCPTYTLASVYFQRAVFFIEPRRRHVIERRLFPISYRQSLESHSSAPELWRNFYEISLKKVIACFDECGVGCMLGP